MSESKPVVLTEKTRVYDYGSHKIELSNVIELVVRDSGTHRIKTDDGLLHVIAPGWFAIHIDDRGKGWTV